jgi:Tfp pilus assembly protein PilN
MADINLVPQQIKQEQKKASVVRSTTVISIVLLLIIAGVAGFMFYRGYKLESEISMEQAEIEALRGKINKLSKIEVVARNLDMKYKTLQDILGDRLYYSVLMQEVDKRLPRSVGIDTLGVGKESTINVSGTGTDYLSISEFVNNLADKEFTDASAGLEGLFTDVSLKSVNLDSQTSEARFFIVITVDPNVLMLRTMQ